MAQLDLYTGSWSAVWKDYAAHGPDNRPEHGVMPVRISVGLPRFWPQANGLPVARLITPYGLRKLKGEGFAIAYKQRLEEKGTILIREELEAIAKEYMKPLVLCCFEAEPKDCHRGQFADWWLEATGERIEEVMFAEATTLTKETE